jgi:pimeloyl-ACP methyl ester carboxylesterase
MRLRFVALLLLATAVASQPAAAASVDGANVHWTSKGSGPAIIFVHGWTCDESSWQGQVPALSERYRVITLDLPGHGKSDLPKDGKFSMELFARAVEAVRSEAKVERAVFVGHSMGTPVIRHYATMYPARVAGLVLVDGLVQVAGITQPITPPPLSGAEGLKVRENFVRSMFGPATTPKLQEHILEMTLATKEPTAAGAFAATWDPSWVKNDPITVPVLGIYAAKPVADRASISRIFPKVEYHEIPGTAHFLMMEKPDEFNQLLTAFVRKVYP